MRESMGQGATTQIKNDPFAAGPVGDISEKFGQMNFNQPNTDQEEEKSQANIDNILGEYKPSSGEVQAPPFNANKLYDFAGMDTVRSDDMKKFDFSDGTS